MRGSQPLKYAIFHQRQDGPQHSKRHALMQRSLTRLPWAYRWNHIAQNYINNDTYYPDDLIENPKFLDHVKRNVPTNRIGAASETAELATYLASENCNHMVGQIIPLAGDC